MPDGAPKKSASLVELSSRLVFSLLKPAVRTAARFGMPVDRLVELSKLAYFEELRAKAPRDLDSVAKGLGVSYRTAVNFNRAVRGDFFRPEKEVEPLRRICGALVDGPRSAARLAETLGDEVSEDQLRRGLHLLVENGWLVEEDGVYRLAETLRSYVSDDLERRVDGLNNLLEVLADTVWQRFVERNASTAMARTWVFAARPEQIIEYVESTVRRVRHEVVDLEEAALREGGLSDRYGVTLAFTPIKED